MNLLELTLLSGQYDGHETGGKIPWNDPDFSRRMLENHLSQEHDWASRKLSVIEQQVDWIARQLPVGAKILDLGCGPGFYTQRLAQRGFDCTGVDFSPASVQWAREQAERAGLSIEYQEQDVRDYQPGDTFDFRIIYGWICSFWTNFLPPGQGRNLPVSCTRQCMAHA